MIEKILMIAIDKRGWSSPAGAPGFVDRL